MSVMQKMVTTIARYMPDAAPDPLRDGGGYIGRPLNRVDGPLKVAGGARFTAEYAPEGLVHAVLVCSTIANGRIAAIDTTVAEAAPGVVGVLTYRNAPRMKAPRLFDVTGEGQGCAPSDLPIMQDDSVRWIQPTQPRSCLALANATTGVRIRSERMLVTSSDSIWT